jgi:hypothetical protein
MGVSEEHDLYTEKAVRGISQRDITAGYHRRISQRNITDGYHSGISQRDITAAYHRGEREQLTMVLCFLCVVGRDIAAVRHSAIYLWVEVSTREEPPKSNKPKHAFTSF